MKNKVYETIKTLPPKGLVVLLGSTGNKVGIAVRKTESLYNLLSDEQKQKIMASDAQDVQSVFDVPMVDKSLEKIGLSHDELVPAEMSDHESLAKAERDKKLWMMNSNWYKRPGVSRDNVGTGGNGRIGHALETLNHSIFRRKIRRNLRKIGDYNLQRWRMVNGEGEIAKNFIPVFVVLSTVGGYGTGTLCPTLQVIRREARDLKLPVKIIVMCLISGSLEPADAETAARNQELVLRELQARVTGEYRDLTDNDSVHELPSDSIILISNANNDGEFNSFDRLIAIAAQHIFYYFYTPLGQKIQEKTVDIEADPPKDHLGGQRCVSTLGYSKIHLDRPRLLLCVAYKLISLFFSSLRANKKHPEVVKLVDIVTAETALSETETHSLAFERILCLRSMGNNDARQHAIALFQQRAGHRWGFGGCCDIDDAGMYTLDVELPQRLIPQIQRETLKLADDAAIAIRSKVTALLNDRDGISKAQQFLEGFCGPIDKFEKANRAKLIRAQNNSSRIKSMLGRVRGLLDKLKGKFWLWRSLSYSTKKEIRRILPPTTEKAIRNQLEIKGRLTLANSLYPKIRLVIAEQLSEVHKIAENVANANEVVKAEIDRLQMFDPILLVPVGNELVTSDFIEEQFRVVLAAEDGTETIAQKIFETFHSYFKNLIAFNHRDIGEIEATLLKYCTGTAKRNLYQLNVADVFRQSCKSTAQQKERIAQAIGESRGRLRIMGEADEDIPTMKFVGVNDRNVGGWVTKLSGQLDPQNGDWEFVEMNDPNTIVFFQQRCRVSLTRIINETARRWNSPCDSQEHAQLGSDPFLSLIPSAGASAEEINTTIAMGLMTGQISLNGKGYQLDNRTGQPIYLGESLEDINRRIAEIYPQMVSLYREFLLKLSKDASIVTGNSGGAVDVADYSGEGQLAQQLGEQPFIRAQEIANALMPYIRRLPLDGAKA